MELKFVYYFTFYTTKSPTIRYRGKYMLDYLKSNYGISSFFVYPDYRFKPVFVFLRAYLSALLFPKKGSLIIIQSVYSKRFYASALKFLVKVRRNRTVYDLDDADYLRFPPETIFYFLKNCAAVTVGSSELLKNLSKYNSNISLITCPVPDINIVKHDKNDILTIGWIGDFTSGHKESLMNLFFPALKELPFRVKLVLLGVGRDEEYSFLTCYMKDYHNVITEIPRDIDWSDEISLQQRISCFDLGIATLLDTEFYRSKSAFKLKQYLNNGVPVLSSDIAENNVFVSDGVNGYLCNTPEEFRRRILEFQEMNKETYRLFSLHARETVPQFSLENFCEELIRLYHQWNQKK